ncbi:MAG: TadE/TadG family type IV pilus assembly protein [Sphingomicrobium sp.]|jgi:Flp pilus assembly protein TadG
MTLIKRLHSDQAGAAAVEAALALPILITLIYGIFEMSQLYWANAGMQHALGEGARLATLCIPDASASTGCDNPSDTSIVAKEKAKLFGPTGAATCTSAGNCFQVQTPTTSSGYKTLTITYTRAMNFLFFSGPTITLTRSKQVYTAN